MRQIKITRKILAMFLPVALFATGLNFAEEKVLAYYPPASQIELEGYELTVSAFGKEYTFRYPEIDFSGGNLYLKNMKEVVNGIFYDTVSRPVDATVKVDPNAEEPFSFSPEKNGKGINEEALSREIEKALSRKQTSVKAEIFDLLPRVYVKDLKDETYLLSSFSTDYSSSSAERKHNIELAVRLLGAKILSSGEVFSFNETVGDRTKERGFKQAKIILEGNYVDGTGGGVCQVSSTLYNAVLTAGLKIKERNPHSLLVSYVEPSFDAMVNSGSSDLKFINQTAGKVYILCRTINGKIDVRVYGKRSKSTYRRVSEVKEYVLPQTEEMQSEEYRVGEKVVKVNAKKGAKSCAYLERYENGKLVERIKLSTDSYSPVKGITLIGTLPVVTEEEETG